MSTTLERITTTDPQQPALAVGLAGALAGVLTLLVVLALLGGVLQLTG